MESLVAWRVFRTVEVSLLPIGHTHEATDQPFSKTFERLRLKNPITLSDVHAALRKPYRADAGVFHMEQVANWLGLCKLQNALRKMRLFSKSAHFSFSAIGGDE